MSKTHTRIRLYCTACGKRNKLARRRCMKCRVPLAFFSCFKFQPPSIAAWISEEDWLIRMARG